LRLSAHRANRNRIQETIIRPFVDNQLNKGIKSTGFSLCLQYSHSERPLTQSRPVFMRSTIAKVKLPSASPKAKRYKAIKVFIDRIIAENQ